MTNSKSLRIALSAFIGATLLVVGGAVSVAGAASSPKLVVTPSTNLKNNQVVKVSGSGFKAKDTVYLVECLNTAKGQSQCNTLGAVPVTITSKGVLPTTKFSVLAGKIGNGACGTKATNLKSCDISAGNQSGGDSTSMRIAFKAK